MGKCLGSLDQRLRDRGITLSLSAEVVEWIAAEGFSPEYGARRVADAVEFTEVRGETGRENSKRLTAGNSSVL